MHVEELRARHPVLHYRSFSVERNRDYTKLLFEFELEPSILFQPQLVIEDRLELSEEEFAPFAFHVGLAELASYWKCACPREIRVSAGALSEEQIHWWHDLLMHGLGEFYFQNQIDFTRPEFLRIVSTPDAPNFKSQALPSEGGLILIAGGKDSSLTLELLSEEESLRPMILNPSRAALESSNLAGFRHPLILRRSIDRSLLELNKQGYLNGHTPFSAYLAFAATAAAAVSGRREIIVSNEKSANQENVVYHDLPINHQYSKSVRFERMFRNYTSRHLSDTIEYFSFLRPLYDLQVAGLFAQHCKSHFSSFRSCNVASSQDRWCGHCSKCAFTYLALSAFLPYQELNTIFGADILLEPKIEEHLRGLIGLSAIKPFECVGTREESLQALRLSCARATHEGYAIPALFARLLRESESLPLKEIVLEDISEEHFIPEQYLYLLEDVVHGSL